MAAARASKPDIPETPFSHSSPPTTGYRPSSSRNSHRESEGYFRPPSIREDQEQQHQQQQPDRSVQYFSSLDSERPRNPGSRSQLGSKESVKSADYPSRGSTRGSSANSRCPFIPCSSCVESCLDTQDAQQHYRPCWVRWLLLPYG